MKIFSESLVRIPVNSKGRINDISTLVQGFVRSIPDQYYRLVQPSRQEYHLMLLCSQKRLAWVWCSSYTLNIVHEEHKIVFHMLVATEFYCAGKICFFPGQLYEISQTQKTPSFCAEKSLLSLFIFHPYQLKILLILWLKKHIKWRKHWLWCCLPMFFLSCRAILFLQVIRGGKIQCGKESIMRHLPCSPSCPIAQAIPF